MVLFPRLRGPSGADQRRLQLYQLAKHGEILKQKRRRKTASAHHSPTSPFLNPSLLLRLAHWDLLPQEPLRHGPPPYQRSPRRGPAQ